MIKEKIFKARDLVIGIVDPFWDWRIGTPNVVERLKKLEKDSHPPKDLCEFEQWETLDNRLKKIEQKIKQLEKK